MDTSPKAAPVSPNGNAPTPLAVLVKHLPSLSEATQRLVLCKLLATSTSVVALIRQSCAGRLSLYFSTYNRDRLEHSLVPWLSKHACLLSSLTLDLSLSNQSWHDAEMAIGAALQKASAAAPITIPGGCGGSWLSHQPVSGLCLTSYSSHPALAGPVLDQLDSWYLTRLELGRHAGYSSSFAIEQMTRLCQLTLVEDSADVLLPCVSALPQLTRLALVDVAASSLAKLSCLPTQLRELQLSLARLRRNEHPPPGLALGHLSCLTKLSNGDGKPLLVQAGDVLPPTLQVLAVRDVLDVTPLLHLDHLSRMGMCASTTPAAQLQLLAGITINDDTTNSSSSISSSRCSPSSSSGSMQSSSSGHSTSSTSSVSSLRSVGLCYGDMAAAAAAAPGWPCLPLDVLELRAAEGTLPAGTVEVLGQLQHLRKLEVYGGGCGGFSQAAVVEATQGQLAAALACMTNLEAVGLRGFGLLEEPGAARGAGGAASPRLGSLVPPSAAPAATPGVCSCAACTGSGCADDTLCAAAAHLSLHRCGSASSTSCCFQGTACPTGAAVVAVDTSSTGVDRRGGGCGGGNCECSLHVLFAALASLPRLSCVIVCSLTCAGDTLAVDAAAAAALGRAASQLTRLQLSDAGLTDAAVNALVAAGLTRVRRLVLDNNAGVTAAVLPDGLAAGLCELRELSVMRTGIRTDAAAFKARMMRLQPRLVVKSSAR